MKFKAEPKLYVKLHNKYVQRVTGRKGLHFDENGEFETDNEVLIKVLTQNFEVIDDEKPEGIILTEAIDAETEKPVEETKPQVIHQNKHSNKPMNRRYK